MDITGSSRPGHNWRLHLLAPYSAWVPRMFRYRLTDPESHLSLLHAMQRLRGQVYLQDGAIEPWELTTDGCHKLAVDDSSWHVLGLDSEGQALGCARYLPHPNDVSFQQLGVSRSELARSEEWGGRLRLAVESDLALARTRGAAFVEVGGWALAESVRNSLAALQIALSTYALAQILGGSIGIGTVTLRHESASILRRIGGSSLAVDGIEMPVYYDPRYKCQMEILRFDSSAPNPRFVPWIESLKEALLSVPVISRSRAIRGEEVEPAGEVATPVKQRELEQSWMTSRI